MQTVTKQYRRMDVLGIHSMDHFSLAVPNLTPLDLERHNNAMKHSDIGHIGLFNWQLGGNRPVPGWSQYKTPVNCLYMSGASTHPGSGVTGGSGRNAAHVILEDLGLDFDRIIK